MVEEFLCVAGLVAGLDSTPLEEFGDALALFPEKPTVSETLFDLHCRANTFVIRLQRWAQVLDTSAGSQEEADAYLPAENIGTLLIAYGRMPRSTWRARVKRGEIRIKSVNRQLVQVHRADDAKFRRPLGARQRHLAPSRANGSFCCFQRVYGARYCSGP